MSPVVIGNGCVTIIVGFEVPVVCFVMQHMPHGNEQFTRNSHDDFHFVLPADLRLMVGETAEEAVLGTACSLGAFYDSLA